MAGEPTSSESTDPSSDMQRIIQLFAQGLHYGVEQVGFDTNAIGKAASQIRKPGVGAINAHDTKIFLSEMIDTIAAAADSNHDRKVTGIELYAMTGNIAEHANQWFSRHVDDPAVLQLLQENISVNMERAENALLASNLDRGAVINSEAVRCVMTQLVDVADAADSFGVKTDNAVALPRDMNQLASTMPNLRSAIVNAVGQCGAIITQAPDTGDEFTSGVAHLSSSTDPSRFR